MESKKRYEVIAFTGYGCVTVKITSTWNRAVKAAKEYKSVVIYDNETDESFDIDGCIID